jgi:hypothetical protein
MAKIGAILGLLALLAGCGESKPKYAMVTVNNTGTEKADGTVQDWDGFNVHHFSVAAGESITIQLGANDDTRIKAHIERSSDRLVLLDDFWENEDLPGHVLTLTVSP